MKFPYSRSVLSLSFSLLLISTGKLSIILGNSDIVKYEKPKKLSFLIHHVKDEKPILGKLNDFLGRPGFWMDGWMGGYKPDTCIYSK